MPSTMAARLQHSVLAAKARLPVSSAEGSAIRSSTKSSLPFIEGIETSEFLDGLHRLSRLAARRAPDLPHRLRQSRSVWGLLRVTERTAVMSHVGLWLSNWPATFITWANADDLTQRYLNREYGPWPDWVWTAIAQLPHSNGPTYFRRPRKPQHMSQLRKAQASISAYREARAALLLKKAGLSSGFRK